MVGPVQPPRNPLRAAPPPMRHPAASHPGFDREEAGGSSGAGAAPVEPANTLGQVLGAVNAGFRQLADLLALHGELTSLREQLLATRHELDIERLERSRLADRVKDLEADVEDTGQHRQKDIDRELERMRGSQAHWVRYVVGALVAAVATLLITTLTRRP